MHFGPETTDKVVALLASGFSTYDGTNEKQTITNKAMKNQTYQTPIVEVMYLLAKTKILVGSGEDLEKETRNFEWE